MAMFIRVDVNQDVIRKTPGVAKKIIDACPVNIFAAGSGESSVRVVEENVDECTLCEMCIRACPEGVRVVKLYES